jgi:hypothetical protein
MTKKQTISAANTEDLTLSTNERILRDCHNLYTDPNNGMALGLLCNSLVLKKFYFFFL